MQIDLPPGKKNLLRSDFHLGVPDYSSSLLRERNWLPGSIKQSTMRIRFIYWAIFRFLVWIQTRDTQRIHPPSGEVSWTSRSRTANLFLHGNHDMWMFDYFKKEMGIVIYREPQELSVNGWNCWLVMAMDWAMEISYISCWRIFNSSICQWLFARLHPNLGIWMPKSGVVRAG